MRTPTRFPTLPKTLRSASALLACIVVAGGCNLAGGNAANGPFTPLIVGGSLDGFAVILDSPWKIENGVASSAQNPAGRLEGESWLMTKKSYQDFILRFEFRVTPGGNSGVFVRDPVSWQDRQAAANGGAPPWDAGYEVNINSRHPEYPTGSIWAVAKGPAGLEKEGEWNLLEVQLQGQRISTWVNGKPAVQNFELPPRSAKGGIGFQRHGTAEYRDKLIEVRAVEIRELP
jgi:hypothetical protein